VTSEDFEIAARIRQLGKPVVLVVNKTDRKMLLMRDDEVLRSFDIALGLEPSGHKREEGDSRTPEGSYRLIERNTDSDFFLSILISYPNSQDRARARAAARTRAAPAGASVQEGTSRMSGASARASGGNSAS